MLTIFLAKSVRVKGKCPTQGRVVSCNALTFVGRNAKLLSLMLLGFIVVLLPVQGYSQVARRNIVHRVMPEYPVLLKSKGIGGIVRCVAVVNPSGSVAKIETLGGNPILVTAAENAVKEWKYEPSSTETREAVSFRFDPIQAPHTIN